MSISSLATELTNFLTEYFKDINIFSISSAMKQIIDDAIFEFFKENVVPFTYDREYLLRRLNELGYVPTKSQLDEACIKISENFLKEASYGPHDLNDVEDTILFESATEQNMREITEEEEHNSKEYIVDK